MATKKISDYHAGLDAINVAKTNYLIVQDTSGNDARLHIDSLSDSISDTLETEIAANTAAISTAQTDIKTNAANIATLQTSVSGLKTQKTCYEWMPYSDVEHWDITAVDHTAGTITLSTEDHGLAVGDEVALVAKVGVPTEGYVAFSFHYMAKYASPSSWPMRYAKTLIIEAVDGAVITCSTLVQSGSYSYTYKQWQLQRVDAAAKTLTLPDYLKGRPLRIHVETQYLNHSGGWCFWYMQNTVKNASGGNVYGYNPGNRDTNVGLPWVLGDLEMTDNCFSWHDMGIGYYGEGVHYGGGGNEECRTVNVSVDTSTITAIQCPLFLGHYACRFLVQQL